MAITQTSLTTDFSATTNTMSVTSGTGFPTVGTIVSPGYLVKVDNEYMYAVAQPTAGVVLVSRRGFLGTAVVAHDLLAKVSVSASPSDFEGAPAGASVPLPGYTPLQQTIGEDLTFSAADIAAFGNQSVTFPIAKATALALTLAAPSKAQDGLTVVFTSLTAAAHVITATALLANAGAASPYTTATVANAKIGGGLTLQAQNGLWNVISATNWTLT